MTKILRSALVLLLLMSVLTGLAYPLLVTAVARLVFPAQAAGSLLTVDGKLRGSSLIGQAFTAPKYFWARPSSTTPTPYDGAASNGSNLGPSNPALVTAAEHRIAALRAADPGNQAQVPVDLVTASASGLDPQISIAAAQYQMARVARLRHMPLQQMAALIQAHTQGRQFGVLGEPRVDVLALNLALDQQQTR